MQISHKFILQGGEKQADLFTVRLQIIGDSALLRLAERTVSFAEVTINDAFLRVIEGSKSLVIRRAD